MLKGRGDVVLEILVVVFLDLLNGQGAGHFAATVTTHPVGDHKERALCLQEMTVLRYNRDEIIFIGGPRAPDIRALRNIQCELQSHSQLFLSSQREVAPATLHPTSYMFYTDRFYEITEKIAPEAQHSRGSLPIRRLAISVAEGQEHLGHILFAKSARVGEQ